MVTTFISFERAIFLRFRHLWIHCRANHRSESGRVLVCLSLFILTSLIKLIVSTRQEAEYIHSPGDEVHFLLFESRLEAEGDPLVVPGAGSNNH